MRTVNQPRTDRLASPSLAQAPAAARFRQGLLIGTAAALLAAGLMRLGLLDAFEARTWDLRARLFARPSPATDRIRLILLDQASLDWARRENKLAWPWPREVYAPLLAFCAHAGAKAVAFDVLFTEPSLYGQFDDDALGEAIATSGRFAGALFLSRHAGGPAGWPDGLARPPLQIVPATTAHGPAPAWLAHRTARSATFPIPEVAREAAVLGDVSAAPDADGVSRRAPLLAFLGDTPVPALSLAAWLAGAGNPAIRLERQALVIGGRSVPLDRSGRALLRYRGPSRTHQAVNAAAVIRSELQRAAGETPEIDPAFFHDAYVLFGFTAPGLYDLRPSPMAGVYPGVEIHATALDNLLAGDFMRDVPPGLALAVMLLLAAGAGTALRLCRTPVQTVFALVALLPLPAVLGWSLYPAGFWMPVAGPSTAVAAALVTAIVANYAAEGRQKRFIKSAFSQYLSPAVIEQLVRNPDRLRLGGEQKEASILFSDIQGFTSLSEGLTPEALTRLLNEYLTAVTEVIYDEGGTIDKYEGDAVIAFWNAPLDAPDHAARAVRAALRYQERLAQIRPRLRELGGHDLFARIGVNTGPVVIGNMGSAQRFNYTFLGDAGNLAARLEGLNKTFGTRILISEATRARAGAGFACREISRVRVVGRREPVLVHEPLAETDAASKRDLLETFARGLALYYDGRFDDAAAAFASIEPHDPPAAVYAARCRLLAANPPPGWDGIWSMTDK